MTFVGHCMTGAAIGMVLMPLKASRRQLIVGLSGCAIAANIPDFKIRNWGHEDYLISHSIFVNIALILLLTTATILFARIFGFKVNGRLFFACAVAWLSHLLLDTFYNHGLGLRMFWPVSDASLALPIPWFHTNDVKAGITAWHNIQEFLFEFLFFSMIVTPAILLQWRRRTAYAALIKKNLDSRSS